MSEQALLLPHTAHAAQVSSSIVTPWLVLYIGAEVSVDLSRLTSVRETLSRAPDATFKIGILRASDARSLGL